MMISVAERSEAPSNSEFDTSWKRPGQQEPTQHTVHSTMSSPPSTSQAEGKETMTNFFGGRSFKNLLHGFAVYLRNN